MSEEEIKAYNFLKFYSNDTENEYFDENYCFDKKYAKTIIKLINKQQKEIEELKKDKKALVDNYNKVLSSFISKDKIREKIKELDKKTFECKCSYVEYYYKNEVLNELLEE